MTTFALDVNIRDHLITRYSDLFNFEIYLLHRLTSHFFDCKIIHSFEVFICSFFSLDLWIAPQFFSLLYLFKPFELRMMHGWMEGRTVIRCVGIVGVQ